jgi:CheY-like chemotaxis protein
VRFKLLKILVVDDNPHMRTIITEVLRAIGVRDLYEASNGDEAMHKLRAHAVDILLTDLAMEPTDGIELVRRLRTNQDSPNQMLPVIMVSGHASERRVRQARDAGVNEFLAKPITVRGVIERIVEVIDRARPFVRCESYFGPDRRRHEDVAYMGPRRRSTDEGADAGEVGPPRDAAPQA